MIKYNYPYFEKHYSNPDYKQEEKYIKDGYVWKEECLYKKMIYGGHGIHKSCFKNKTNNFAFAKIYKNKKTDDLMVNFFGDGLKDLTSGELLQFAKLLKNIK